MHVPADDHRLGFVCCALLSSHAWPRQQPWLWPLLPWPAPCCLQLPSVFLLSPAAREDAQPHALPAPHGGPAHVLCRHVPHRVQGGVLWAAVEVHIIHSWRDTGWLWERHACPRSQTTPLHMLPLSSARQFEDPPLHDPCAVAYVIAPHLFKASTPAACCAALFGHSAACPSRRFGRFSCCQQHGIAFQADGAAARGCGDLFFPLSRPDGGGHLAPVHPAQELHRVHGATRDT